MYSWIFYGLEQISWVIGGHKLSEKKGLFERGSLLAGVYRGGVDFPKKKKKSKKKGKPCTSETVRLREPSLEKKLRGKNS